MDSQQKTSPAPQTALITGGGNRIGAAIAHHLAARGWHLVLHYHQSGEAAETLATALRRSHGVRVATRRADLAGPVEDFWRGLPPCDALVLNAALFERDRLATMDEACLARQMQVNFLAPVGLIRGFMAQLPDNAPGSVTILGDGIMGWSISPEFFSYALSKQAWIGALDVIAAACAPRARVNMLALAPTLPGAQDDAAMFMRLAARAPLQRTGTPQEVCAAVEYLLQAPGVTGQVLSLAGGAGLLSARPSGGENPRTLMQDG